MSLRSLIKEIRATFKGRFTAKMRIGYHNTDTFLDAVRMLNDEGVEMITVHGRTRDMMYKEPARWEFIAEAVKVSQVPIIGNGDIWNTTDIDRMLKETGCHGVMAARGAGAGVRGRGHMRVAGGTCSSWVNASHCCWALTSGASQIESKRCTVQQFWVAATMAVSTRVRPLRKRCHHGFNRKGHSGRALVITRLSFTTFYDARSNSHPEPTYTVAHQHRAFRV